MSVFEPLPVCLSVCHLKKQQLMNDGDYRAMLKYPLSMKGSKIRTNQIAIKLPTYVHIVLIPIFVFIFFINRRDF